VTTYFPAYFQTPTVPIVAYNYRVYGYGVSRHFPQYFSFIVAASCIGGVPGENHLQQVIFKKNLIGFQMF